MIIYSKLEVAVSQSLIIFCCVHQRIHLSLVSRISLLTGCDAMFAWGKLCVPIAYVYMSFLLRSIFLALNTSMHWTYHGKEITNMPEDVV